MSRIIGLRPVEEFRHTPLIPISEKRMAEHKEKLEAYHRGGLYFEVKKETIANYRIKIGLGEFSNIL